MWPVHFMLPFGADPVSAAFSTETPTLTSFAGEVCATLARLFAYVGSVALPAILTLHFWE